MKVTSARFVISAIKPSQLPKRGFPECAFVGRSNVGKSSLMNVLLGRKGLAKTSGTPGKTQMLNFFEVNEKIYFVDLPGYGFAKVPIQVKENWRRVMSEYLKSREPLRLVVILVDSRHAPSDNDSEMLELLDEAEVPTLIVATKVDKLKRSQRSKSLKTIREELELDEDALITPFSAVTGEGKREIWRVIDELIS